MTQAPQQSEAGGLAFLRCRRFARQSALQVLYQVDVNAQHDCPSNVLEDFWEQALVEADPRLSDQHVAEARGFAEKLISGVVAEHPALDQRLEACAENWTVGRMSVVDRNILRLAAYELSFCDEIPALATIDEAIELAKQFGDRDSPRFVNGVLDRMFHAAGTPAEAE